MMRREKKNKTGFLYPQRPSGLQIKRKHRSLILSLNESSLKAVQSVLEDLLKSVHEEQLRKKSFARHISNFLYQFDAVGNSYFELELPMLEEVCCHLDVQPQADETKTLEVVPPGHIKKLIRVPAGSKTDHYSLHEQVCPSVCLQQKKQRDGVIQKLKKEYMMTLKTKYLSLSSPIFEGQPESIDQGDIFMVQQIRKSFNKQVLSKKPQKKIQYWHDESPRRKENKRQTVFKKSKAFIDRIDPTNSIYNKSQITKDQNSKTQQRTSVYYDRQCPMEESITAKASNLSEVTNFITSAKEKGVPFQHRRSKENIRFPPLLSAQKIQVSKRSDFSFHLNPKVGLTSINQSQKRIRIKNSMSVVELPKIKRNL